MGRSRRAHPLQARMFVPEPPPTFCTPDTGTATLYVDPTALVVSASGGLDSDATALWVRKTWPEHRIIMLYFGLPCADWATTPAHLEEFADTIGNCTIYNLQAVHELTGAQTPTGMNSTRLRRVHDFADGPITDNDPAVITSLLDFTRRARLNNPPTKAIRWCTKFFKSLTSDAWCRQHRALLGDRAILFTGERHAESDDRATLNHWEWRDIGLQPCKAWPEGWNLLWVRPVIERRLHEVARMVYDAGISLNESYIAQGESWETVLNPARDERGRARHSCSVCIFTRQEHLATALARRPDLVAGQVAEVLAFEAETGKTWQQRGPLGVEMPFEVAP